jgi:hypothetical protein
MELEKWREHSAMAFSGWRRSVMSLEEWRKEYAKTIDLAAGEGTSVIDVEKMDGEVTREADNKGGVFIAAQGVVVRIKVMANTS